MKKINIAISPCPNDIFIFSGLILGKVGIPGYESTFRYEDIDTLNKLALAGEMDLLKISYANYSRCRETYNLLPCGGALGRGVGPLLLTGGDDFSAERVVFVPGEYTTANFLLDFWAARSLRKEFVVFNALYDRLKEATNAQGVVIHEKRFTYAADGLRLIQDLGEYWEEKTGCPIPLGCAISKKNLAPELLSTSIRDSLTWAYGHKDEALELCQRYATDLTPAVMQAHIDLYVNEFSFDLGTVGQAAVEHFFKQIDKRVAVG